MLHLDGEWHSHSADLSVATAAPPALQQMTAGG
jgi:hypothetical protein